jgi:hypothetical protein
VTAGRYRQSGRLPRRGRPCSAAAGTCPSPARTREDAAAVAARASPTTPVAEIWCWTDVRDRDHPRGGRAPRAPSNWRGVRDSVGAGRGGEPGPRPPATAPRREGDRQRAAPPVVAPGQEQDPTEDHTARSLISGLHGFRGLPPPLRGTGPLPPPMTQAPPATFQCRPLDCDSHGTTRSSTPPRPRGPHTSHVQIPKTVHSTHTRCDRISQARITVCRITAAVGGRAVAPPDDHLR